MHEPDPEGTLNSACHTQKIQLTHAQQGTIAAPTDK
jgi:hypothetical protein